MFLDYLHILKGVILEWACFSEGAVYPASKNKAPPKDEQDEFPEN